MTIELSREAAERLKRLADQENVTPTEFVEALIATETARREAREA